VCTLQRSIENAFSGPFHVKDSEFRLDPCSGAAIYRGDGSDCGLLLRNAETAAADARSSGSAFHFYAEQMTARGAERLAMEARLRRALDRGEFVLHYQPKVGLRSGKLGSVEALIRWMSPELGLVYPAQFIPLLEETGLIVEVGAWVLRQAVADQRRWSLSVANAPRIAVNVSTSQLHDPGFATLVAEAVGSEGPVPIDLEITESLLMNNVEASIATLAAIRALGIGISIDDFGTGYSSLAYLARLPVAAIKIDRLFIARMLEDAGTMKLIATMIDLAHSLELTVVAEGVESGEQALALRALGCDEIQGYLVGRPATFEAITALLAAGGKVPGFPADDALDLAWAGAISASANGGLARKRVPSA
jgi:EAL domain-containing protein (putative c-di-GMP-specific phosphodiesterase class I)